MPFAVRSFQHFELKVASGDELPADHPMVVARPDLFTAKPKPKRAKSANPKE